MTVNGSSYTPPRIQRNYNYDTEYGCPLPEHHQVFIDRPYAVPYAVTYPLYTLVPVEICTRTINLTITDTEDIVCVLAYCVLLLFLRLLKRTFSHTTSNRIHTKTTTKAQKKFNLFRSTAQNRVLKRQIASLRKSLSTAELQTVNTFGNSKESCRIEETLLINSTSGTLHCHPF